MQVEMARHTSKMKDTGMINNNDNDVVVASITISFIAEAGACFPTQMTIKKVCHMIADDISRVSVRVI